MHFTSILSFVLILLKVKLLLALPSPAPLSDAASIQESNNTRLMAPALLPNYDYVVVGSGPGGGPLASRLAIAGFKVLLIDAGDDQGTADITTIPAMQFPSAEYINTKWDFFVSHYQDTKRQQRDSKFTWRTPSGSLYTGKNPPAGSNPLGILYPRAGTLGGCSMHNALVALLPHDSDFNYIQQITGDASWAASTMKKHFVKLERNQYSNSVLNGAGHGFSGYLGTAVTQIGLLASDSKITSMIYSAASAIKGVQIPIVSPVLDLISLYLSDINAPGQNSVPGLYQMVENTFNGARSSSRDIIMDTVNARNPDGSRKYILDLQLNTVVTKVRFDQSGPKPRAVGVDFLLGKSLYRADPRSGSAFPTSAGSVDVTREVILSAGAFNTPQLLKLSGVGPRQELQKFNIPVVVDLPGVGTNLQDRPESAVANKFDGEFTSINKCTFLQTPDDPCLKQWKTSNPNIPGTARGIYASNLANPGVIFKSSQAEGDPDVFIVGVPGKFTGYFPGFVANTTADFKHFTWLVLKAHTRATAGTVQLRSADPLDTPIINFNYFDTGVTTGGADQKDLQAAFEGVTFARKMFSMAKPTDGSKLVEDWPGPNYQSEADTKQFIKDEAWGHHASCSVPIGADSDPMAALDSKFRVRGTTGLRVVDASVFPKIPGYFIALPTFIISEKAAETILQG